MAKKINLKPLKDDIKKNKAGIKGISESLKPEKPRPEIKNGKKSINIRRALIRPDCSSKTVLTDSTWSYVDIFLRQQKTAKAKEALFYWEQSKNFYEATVSLSLVSKPLTTYYCFLNATKALLTYKEHNFNLKHGVSGKRIDNGRIKLQNEIISLKPKGVLSGLCEYLGNPVKANEPSYSLKDILYNLPFVHRAFQLTFDSPTTYGELYIPIQKSRFVFDKFRKKGWFEAELEKEHSNKSTLGCLVGFGVDRKYKNKDYYVIRRNKTFKWDTYRNKPTQASLTSFENYYFNIRNKLRYIYSANDLWYIKRTDLKNHIIERNTSVLILAGMHRLSELSRYQPQTLEKHLESDHSWLLIEFINKSLLQFIDNISSEITGKDFRVTGFRT